MTSGLTWGAIKFITPASLPQSIIVLGSGNYLCLTPALHGFCRTYPAVCKLLLAQLYRANYCYLAWKCSPIEPHHDPDVDLEKTTSCSTVQSWIGSCFCRYSSPVLVWYRVACVAIQVIWNQWHYTQHIFHWTDVKCQQYCCWSFVQHGDTLPLHATVQSKADGFKCAGKIQWLLLILAGNVHLTSAAQSALEK